jgi:homoserine acetyltransferase
MAQTWQNGDVSKQEPYNGDFEAALAAIRAKVLVLPAKTDLYFPSVIPQMKRQELTAL